MHTNTSRRFAVTAGALFAFALSFGCGGDVPPSPSPSTPVCTPPACVPPDALFVGAWTSHGTAMVDGAPRWENMATLIARVDGNRLSIEGVCPGGDGRIGAEGSGKSVTWNGEVLCEFPTATCPTGRLWLTSGEATVSNYGMLSVDLFGQYICGDQYVLASVEFMGQR